jgi:hypothetical protein
MRAHLADSGYASTATFTTPTEGILLIATSRTNPTDNPDHHNRAIHQPAWQSMTDRLNNPAGKPLYRRRAGKIEPVFAQLFRRGGRNLHHRGAAAHTEITLLATAHNAGKLITHTHQRKHPPLTTQPTNS